MTLLMRDSIDPALIPLDGLAAIAGYADGLYQWSAAGWARFPASIIPLSIVVNPADQGDILDVERFDALPDDCPGWANRFNRPHRRRPTIYSARGTDSTGRVDWSIIQAILNAMAGRPFDWWMATLDGSTDYAGAPKVPVAIQYRDFGGYDESVILDPSWLGPQEVSMVILKTATAITGTLVSGELVVDLAHTEDVVALQAAGVQIVTVTQDLLDRVHASAAALTGSVTGQLSVSGQLQVK